MRVLIAEDSVLLREGLARLLTEAGIEVAAQVDTAGDFRSRVRADPPDVCIVDVRMPPANNVDGLLAAIELRAEIPDFKVMIRSQYAEPHYALELLNGRADGVGYLMKERVGAPSEFINRLGVVADRGTAIDPEVVSQLFARPRNSDSSSQLSLRESEVLSAMAEGMTNTAIAGSLFMSQKKRENPDSDSGTSWMFPLSISTDDGDIRIRRLECRLTSRIGKTGSPRGYSAPWPRPSSPHRCS